VGRNMQLRRGFWKGMGVVWGVCVCGGWVVFVGGRGLGGGGWGGTSSFGGGVGGVRLHGTGPGRLDENLD